MVEAGSAHDPADHLREYRIVDGGRALRCPDKAFEPVAGVDDPELHRVVHLAVQVVARLAGLLPPEAHEDERCDLKTANEDFHARPGIPAADPRVLLVGDLVDVAANGGDELVAEFDGPVLPVDLLVRGVEGMVGHHLERGEVPAGFSYGVEVIEPDARLGDGERVCRRRDNAACHKRLEIRNRGDGEVDIVPPAGHDRVTFDPRVPLLLKKGEVGLAHGIEGVRSEDRVADEIIGFAGSIPADLPGAVAGPECRTADFADLADKTLGFKVIELVFLFEHALHVHGIVNLIFLIRLITAGAGYPASNGQLHSWDSTPEVQQGQCIASGVRHFVHSSINSPAKEKEFPIKRRHTRYCLPVLLQIGTPVCPFRVLRSRTAHPCPLLRSR